MTDTSTEGTQRIVESPANSQPGESTQVEPGVDMNRLVRILAGRVLARLPRDSGIEMSDLIQAGNLGLLQAARTFRPENGAPLAGYAKFRIRGEMLDTVRRNMGRSAGRSTAVPALTAEWKEDLQNRVCAPPEHSPLCL